MGCQENSGTDMLKTFLSDSQVQCQGLKTAFDILAVL